MDNHNSSKNLIGACGINCRDCDIYLASKNVEIAKRLIKAFAEKGVDLKLDDFKCGTCRGPSDECWNEDCFIQRCCIEKRNLKYCYECQGFPCKDLKEWANQNARYTQALNNLKEMKEEEN